jgi:hypothetical protein
MLVMVFMGVRMLMAMRMTLNGSADDGLGLRRGGRRLFFRRRRRFGNKGIGATYRNGMPVHHQPS